jgi:hemoglobin
MPQASGWRNIAQFRTVLRVHARRFVRSRPPHFMTLHDIDTRDDIDALMRAFYASAMSDDVIGFLFTDVAALDLDEHLPVIGDFWESVLFGSDAYRKHRRSPLQIHAELHEREALRREHFERWLELFTRIVDQHFAGPRAEFAKLRAQAIARRIQEFLAAPPLVAGV